MPLKKRKNQAKMAAVKSVTVAQRKSPLQEAVKKQKQRPKRHWHDFLESFTMMTSSIENKKGRVWSYEENCMLLLAINAFLGRAVKANSDTNQHISWQSIEEEVVNDFCVRWCVYTCITVRMWRHFKGDCEWRNVCRL